MVSPIELRPSRYGISVLALFMTEFKLKFQPGGISGIVSGIGRIKFDSIFFSIVALEIDRQCFAPFSLRIDLKRIR